MVKIIGDFGSLSTVQLLLMTLTASLQRVAAFGVALLGLATAQAQAATFTVTNTHDFGAGSLRQAVDYANGSSSNDTIVFDIPSDSRPPTINLTTGHVVIAGASAGKLSIIGPRQGQLVLSGNNTNRIFSIASGANVTLSFLTFRQGRAQGGGAILNNRGTLTVNDSLFTENNASLGAAGGAILSLDGRVTVNRSTFSHNSSTSRPVHNGVLLADGGAIANRHDSRNPTLGFCTVNQSTFLENSSMRGFGGALSNSNGSLTINSCTLTRNSVGNGQGSGVFNVFGTTTLNSSTVYGNIGYGAIDNWEDSGAKLMLNNNIVANNRTPAGKSYNFDGAVNEGDYNLVDTPNIALPGSHNVYGQDPQLGPLANNGGPTLNFALLAGSPAIDAGNSTFPTDQRGASRPSHGADDIGAFEFMDAPPRVVSVTPHEASDNVGAERTFTVTLNDKNGVADIKNVWLLINTQLDWSGGATLVFEPRHDSRPGGLLYLRRGDSFLGPLSIGPGSNSGHVLDNGAVRVVGHEVGYVTSADGTTLTLTLSLTIRDGLVGANKVFARVENATGAVDPEALPNEFGFVRSGSYVVRSQFAGAGHSAPMLSRLAPGAASTRLNDVAQSTSTQTFSFGVSDANGTGDVQEMWFMANTTRDWAGSATFVFLPRTRRLYLRSDDGQSFLGGGQIGSAGSIENSQVKVDLSQVKLSLYPDGKSLGLNLPLQAKSGLIGDNKVWLRVQDSMGATSPVSDEFGFVQSGTWTVNLATSPDPGTSPSPSAPNS